MSRLFCFGLGYSAGFLAAELAARGWSIAGTSRETASLAAPAARGYAMHEFSRARPLADAAAALAGATHVLIAAPPDEAGCPTLACHGADLAALGGLGWVGYLSTTGVYGDRGGALVDEATPPAPRAERSRRRLAAETGWLALWRTRGLPLHVFRLAGIYGPGRNALEQLRAGSARPVTAPDQLFSRIHVADLVAVLIASMARPAPGRLYNVCDDEPASAEAVIAHAAALLGVAAPPAVPLAAANLSPLAASFYAEHRRVANRRIKDELGVRLRYPSYRDGLADLAAGRGAGIRPP